MNGLYPYAGTSGWSGSQTSLLRALDEDASGETAGRQRTALDDLVQSGSRGLTWKELGDKHGWHHGKSSGVLSVLHKEGRIARLTLQRDRCAVYVMPNNLEGRPTSAHRSTQASKDKLVVEQLRGLAEKYVGDLYVPMNEILVNIDSS